MKIQMETVYHKYDGLYPTETNVIVSVIELFPNIKWEMSSCSPTSTCVAYFMTSVLCCYSVIQYCFPDFTWHSPLTHPLLPSRSLLHQRWMHCRVVVVFMFPWSWSLQLPVSLAALRLRKAMASSTSTDLADDGDSSFILWFIFSIRVGEMLSLYYS